ncbi:MAG: hypothetical protein ABSF43_07155 [Rectinemataceae bacterium]
MPDEIDPEIAALIGDLVEEPRTEKAVDVEPTEETVLPPDFTSLFGDMGAAAEARNRNEFDVDLTRKGFDSVKKIEADKPATWFSDPNYYKTVLGGEGEEATKLHELLGKYIKATDAKDKGVYRQQLIPAYWYIASKLALHSIGAQVPLPKKIAVRFAAILPNLLSPDMTETFHRVVFEKEINEPVYYIDEWMRAVASGLVSASATDEVKPRAKEGDDKSRFAALIQRAQGKRDASEGIMKAKVEERRQLESLLKERVEGICSHQSQPGLVHVPASYTESQKKTMSELYDVIRKMLAVDKELSQVIGDFDKAGDDLKGVQEKAGPLGQSSKADMQALAQEFDTLHQMTRLCIGRQGNHFPLLSREYFHGGLKDVATRENVVHALAWIESIDCEAFCRPYKSALNRIVPFILLVPCYGDSGVCWEPFDNHNRATSRGRVAIPMYPKNLSLAVLTAVADLRWQVAKEKASYYWMEEGLTGNYYQWFQSRKIRGDVKEFFIQDYLVWLTKESEGIQKLDKEIRGIFWRYMPFSKEIKEKLKTRSYVYQELYQKDVNRSLSDGY